MPGRDRYARESAPRRADKNNLWIRLDRRNWYTPDEYRYKFGEDPQNVKDNRVELLNPMIYLRQGREVIKKMIAEQKTPYEITLAIEKLFEFEDKLLEHQYKPGIFQVDKALWPDPELPPRPKPQPEQVPDYNDLSNEKTELAIETAKRKAKELEEAEKNKRHDKYTRSYR